VQEKGRSFIDKVAAETRDYVQSLLDDNQRLQRTTAQLEVELATRDRMEAALRERVATIEEESRTYSQRYVEVELQNTNLANLYVASYQLHGTLSRARILAAIKEIVINLIGSEELAIWELAGDQLVLSDSFGIDEGTWSTLPVNEAPAIIRAVTVTGAPFIKGQTLIAGAGAEEHLTAAIPLKLDDRVIGVIGVFRLLSQKPLLEPIDYELFDLLSSHAASALYCTRGEFGETAL
jgi:hypothetical protein